jgi:ribosomal protein S18 acetylase RimI-like enzyme
MLDDRPMAPAEPCVEVWRMRVELDPDGLGEPRWPDGVGVQTFSLSDAASLHGLLEHGYRKGGGSVAPFDTWLPQMTTDEEFDPELWVLAELDGALAGAVLCWKSGFVKDLVVHESWRRRGLGEALLRHALTLFADRGVPAVELKVHSTNRNAVALYERVGMRVVERLQES